PFAEPGVVQLHHEREVAPRPLYFGEQLRRAALCQFRRLCECHIGRLELVLSPQVAGQREAGSHTLPSLFGLVPGFTVSLTVPPPPAPPPRGAGGPPSPRPPPCCPSEACLPGHHASPPPPMTVSSTDAANANCTLRRFRCSRASAALTARSRSAAFSLSSTP